VFVKCTVATFDFYGVTPLPGEEVATDVEEVEETPEEASEEEAVTEEE
jgi:hypothetical protein